jgi:hypothetical protein
MSCTGNYLGYYIEVRQTNRKFTAMSQISSGGSCGEPVAIPQSVSMTGVNFLPGPAQVTFEVTTWGRPDSPRPACRPRTCG